LPIGARLNSSVALLPDDSFFMEKLSLNTVTIRAATAADAPAIARIYNYYIAHSVITFEEQPVSDDDMAERIVRISQQGGWLVAVQNNSVVGYAYAGEWKSRSAYRFSVESSVYLDVNCAGQGIGSQLSTELLARLTASGIRIVIAGIALPNEASVRLHEKMGFRFLGKFTDVGFKHDQWIDVGYWEKNLQAPF